MSLLLIYFFISALFSLILFLIYAMADVSLESPVIQFVPLPHPAGYSCERVFITGTSRLNLKHYASSLHVTLNASDATPEKIRGKIEVCSHR